MFLSYEAMSREFCITLKGLLNQKVAFYVTGVAEVGSPLEVKKPNGGKPGFVVYYTNYSLVTESDIQMIQAD